MRFAFRSGSLLGTDLVALAPSWHSPSSSSDLRSSGIRTGPMMDMHEYL